MEDGMYFELTSELIGFLGPSTHGEYNQNVRADGYVFSSGQFYPGKISYPGKIGVNSINLEQPYPFQTFPLQAYHGFNQGHPNNNPMFYTHSSANKESGEYLKETSTRANIKDPSQHVPEVEPMDVQSSYLSSSSEDQEDPQSTILRSAGLIFGLMQQVTEQSPELASKENDIEEEEEEEDDYGDYDNTEDGIESSFSAAPAA